ncbi:UDP-GlcNAc:betaGal beta-1,3-N-acetylglucosaminyltransferase 8-like [Amblyomma americanum]
MSTYRVQAPKEAHGRGPGAEVVSCALCNERLSLGAAPLNGRLVWRAESRSHEVPPIRNHDVLWDFPDLYIDSWATWTPCPTITALVTSTPERRAQRDTIRATWGRLDQYSNCSLRVVFFMTLEREPTLSRLLKAENKQFHDIVVQRDTSDMRQPASSTAALLVEWVPANMVGSQFALRVTDDTHVHVRALLYTLSRLGEPSAAAFIFGRASRNKQHLEGCAYMAKSEAFLRLQPTFADEELDEEEGPLVTGRLARKAGLVAVHLEGFGPCDRRVAAAQLDELLTTGNDSTAHLTIRGLTPEKMVLLHRRISTTPSLTALFRAATLRTGAHLDSMIP